jgi:hypothetical protein
LFFALAASISFCVLLGSSQGWLKGVLIGAAVLIIPILGLDLFERRFSRKNIAKRSHPEVASLLEDGWIEGSPPKKLSKARKVSAAATGSLSSELSVLRKEVAALEDMHPRNPMASISRSEIQIPWICRTLDEAVDALQTGKDPFGNVITQAQILGGLRQLVSMVRKPSYITQMEMAYPGIGGPLKGKMDTLESTLHRYG